MTRFIFLMSALMCINTSVALYAFTPPKTHLSGRVTNINTGEAIPGVSIYLPDLKRGTQTNSDGIYKIENLPASRILVQVSFIGHNIIAQVIDLTLTQVMDFQMRESVNELNEIVVTGLSEAAEKNRTPTPIATIAPAVILQSPSMNIIETLSRQPGISQISTGPAISKPVIRGLGYNRIITLQDGVRQEGQQWGDEHGIEIDEFAVSKVEILKGPASLAYGSDALAGVINLISAPTLPEGSIKLNVISKYHTNNGLFGASVNTSGNSKGFIWDLRYSNKRAHAYQNKFDGPVYNSGLNEYSSSAIAGINKSWGYSHVHLSSFNQTLGIVEGDRDSLSGKFVKTILSNSGEMQSVVDENNFKSYSPDVPYQKINHSRIVMDNIFIIRNSSLKLILGWQQNRRKEFDDISDRKNYGLFFHMNTFNYDFRYVAPSFNNFYLSAGINGMNQRSENRGTEFLIPEYHLSDFGAYVLLKKPIKKFDVNGGIRFDIRNITGEELLLNGDGSVSNYYYPGVISKFTPFGATFTGITGSFGITYQFNDKSFSKFNAARGFRSPNISELSSNGVHEGSLRYELGQPGLKAEESLQFDLAFGIIKQHVTAEIDFFTGDIDNFIYLSKVSSYNGGDSINNDNIVFRYTSGNARLTGGEFTIDIHPHPLDWLHFENSVSYVNGIQTNQPDSSKYLPLIPPLKITSEVRTDLKSAGKFLRNIYFKFSVEKYLKQEKYFSSFNTETSTPGYTLLSAGFGADIVNSKKNTICTIYINVSNLADESYQSHLSRLKYAGENYFTGRKGVFNTGRDFSFKLIVPVNLAKK